MIPWIREMDEARGIGKCNMPPGRTRRPEVAEKHKYLITAQTSDSPPEPRAAAKRAERPAAPRTGEEEFDSPLFQVEKSWTGKCVPKHSRGE